MRYADEENAPYEEDFDATKALILATDQDNGYLILDDAARLHPMTLERFVLYRGEHKYQELHELQ